MEPVVQQRGVAMFGYMPAEERVEPGAVTVLLERAMATVVDSVVAAGADFELAELRTSFIRPVGVGAGPLRVEGQVMHAGVRAVLAEARIVDAEGRLFAHATCTAVRVDSLAA